MIEQSAGTGPPEGGTWGKPGKLGKPWGNCKREREQEQVRERERDPLLVHEVSAMLMYTYRVSR